MFEVRAKWNLNALVEGDRLRFEDRAVRIFVRIARCIAILRLESHFGHIQGHESQFDAQDWRGTSLEDFSFGLGESSSQGQREQERYAVGSLFVLLVSAAGCSPTLPLRRGGGSGQCDVHWSGARPARYL